MLAASKGTTEYENIMKRLMELNYKHQEQGADDNKFNPEDAKVDDNNKLNLLNQESMHESHIGDKKEALVANSDEFVAKDVSMGRIMTYYYPKWMAVIAFIVSIINAFSFPIYGLIYAKLLFVLMSFGLPINNFYEERDFWSGMFLLEVFILGLVSFLQKYLFLYVGENLTFDIRNELFAGIVYKHLSWFDNKDRAPGILSNVLSEDIGVLNGMTTEHIAIIMEAILGLLIGVVLALFYTWRLGLISLALVPFVAFGGIIGSRLHWKTKPNQSSSVDDGVNDPYKKSNALLSDIIMNYRTVIGFGEKNVDYLLTKFDKLLEVPNMQGIRSAHVSGFWFGYSQCVRFIFIGVVFYISAIFINKKVENPQDTYIGVYTLFVAAIGTGVSLAQAPSVEKAKKAAKTIFAIIDEPSKIDTRDEKGEKVIKHGEIEFLNADFQYPSRNQKVLNSMNMKIPATKKIALVGHSGCGKSTTANLLLRLYDLTGGKLLIDGIDIRDYNVRELRKQIGIVMQEPLLFNTTIKENILYGNDKADDIKVRQVAQMANALQFIESNIEDLDKEDVQVEIGRRFIEKCNSEKEQYTEIGHMSMLYDANKTDGQHLSFEEMRIIEEVLI